ncbi:hypothetical protein NDN01_18765 [Sphingomonas sp. QA11]|uniref:hypothetical protein n=1 Tax=Sphingomonas sp. QA11 TaxID=2950605 RepID=UPI00234ADC18|nr:hypothetical protein [Sphingomonas sp. QA11]WCM26038.1 hypothetical protein NDN01_18765 [Sphingomonas sp. QA11]
MMISVYRAAALSTALVLGIGASAVPGQAQDCRSIADPARRLACYDQQQGAPAATPAPAAGPARPEPDHAALREAKAPEPAALKSGFRSTIAGISPKSFGLYELRLADGSVWSTTTSGGERPAVGDAVTYRRSMLGAHFFDIKGRRSVTVRRER